VSAEVFAARKRRIVAAWIGAGVLVALLAAWTYRRSVDPLDAQRAVEEGRRLLKATRYPEAILSFDHALALKDDLPEAYLLRGRARMAVSSLEPAIRDFDAVIRLRPGDAEGFVERAQAHLRMEQYAAAILDSGAALAHNPKIALAYTLRAIALRQSGRPQQALEDLNRSVDLAPNESNYFQRAATYQAMGQHKLALADLNQVIELKPDGPQAYFARAQSRLALGDQAGANQDRKQGLLLDGR
jgi:tetratricopeptide (TPR) repeat protein